jgi:hypothetical protein
VQKINRMPASVGEHTLRKIDARSFTHNDVARIFNAPLQLLNEQLEVATLSPQQAGFFTGEKCKS